MKEIIWRMPWDLYKDYKAVRNQIRELRGYKELKEKESRLAMSMLVTSVAMLGLGVVIIFLALT